ncbi:MAG: hypothetical protein KKA52_05855 [Candidatus Omnitrophica bacterium]|nr:hypothetical protein [Candidatus Omnitrophota bacterium]
MSIIKQTRENTKKVNWEYVLLFFVLVLAGLLIYSVSAISQSPPEQITLTTFYPFPFGEFTTLKARVLLDYDDQAYKVDPNGTSQMRELQIATGINTPMIGSTASGYSINFSSGGAYLNNLTVQNRITMGAATPGGTNPPIAGKHVYDIAESISAKDCQPGDTVVISQDKDCVLARSQIPYDTRVAGVISEDPKLCLGQGEGELPLALAGIVKCKVTAENGPIKNGDLLVTSSLAGYAMRAAAGQIKPGMLLGKALQPHTEGKGKIFILVNKQ